MRGPSSHPLEQIGSNWATIEFVANYKFKSKAKMCLTFDLEEIEKHPSLSRLRQDVDNYRFRERGTTGARET